MDEKEIIIIAAIAIPIALVIIVIVLFSVFARRKNRLLQEQAEAKKAFDRELAESQIEIREETLRNISWELHDNIGQLMTLAKIQSQMAREKPEMLVEVSETIGTGINELRALSKLINPEALKSLSLKESISLEIERFNRLKFIESELIVVGGETTIDAKNQVILFRILQEFFSNTIKHSRATKLKVILNYSDNDLIITAQDNGVGFSDEDDFTGIGLKNMKMMAELIN
jgi:signal transduction histidine kinase